MTTTINPKQIARNARPGLFWRLTSVHKTGEDSMEATFEKLFTKNKATVFFEWCGSRTVFS